VDGREEHFGDGSMRQVTPLSPAMHLGARKILVIGVGQPERPGLGGAPGCRRAPPAPRWAAWPAM
jgi:NTE family protein